MSDAPQPATPPTDPLPLPDSSPAPRAWVLPLLSAAAYLLFWQIVLRLPGSLPTVLLTTIISLGLMVWLPAQIARSVRHPGALGLLMVGTAALILPMQASMFLRRPLLPWSYLLFVPGMDYLLLIVFASSLGALLSFILRGANMIPPVAAVLALVDIWTVLLGGPVQKIMQSQDPRATAITQTMIVNMPTPPRIERGAAPFRGSVGFADFLFIAFFVGGICRFVPGRATYRRTLAVLVVTLCVYMLAVLMSGLNLPALVPMSVVVIALHWRHFHYRRSEIYALLYAAVFIALIIAGFGYFALR